MPKSTVPPITTATTLQTQKTTTAVTTPLVAAPTSSLKPGDTGKQVKILQGALKALGFLTGKPDGDYGPKRRRAPSSSSRARRGSPPTESSARRRSTR